MASCVSLGMRAKDTNLVGYRSSPGRRAMRRDSWIDVFSEKFILAGSWLVTMVSIWKRSERNFRSWVDLPPFLGLQSAQ